MNRPLVGWGSRPRPLSPALSARIDADRDRGSLHPAEYIGCGGLSAVDGAFFARLSCCASSRLAVEKIELFRPDPATRIGPVAVEYPFPMILRNRHERSTNPF